MASASSRRSLDTDSITLRRVFAKVSDNRNPPYGSVLTGVGDAQTYWANPSTLGMAPTFNEIIGNTTSFYASTLSTFSLLADTAIGMSTFTPSTLGITARTFGQMDVSGSNSLYAYSNFTLNGTLKVAAQGFVSSVTDTTRNILYLSSTRQAPALSTGLIGYQYLKVNSTVTTPIDLTNAIGNATLSIENYNTYPSFIGYRDFILHPTVQPSLVQLELSSYSAEGFLAISSLVGTNFLSTLSTISSIYVDKTAFSTAMRSLSTTEGSNTASSFSTLFGLSNATQVIYNNKMGEVMNLALIIQLTDQFGILNTGLSTISSVKAPVYIMASTNQYYFDFFSSPKTLGISTFSNFTAGSLSEFTVSSIYAYSTQLSTLSTQIGYNELGFYISTTSINNDYIQSMFSTTKGLGTLEYISSASLTSSLRGAATLDYISTKSLTSTAVGLSNSDYIHQLKYLSAFSINYTLYPSPSQFTTILTSTTKGIIDHAPYISSATFTSTLTSTTKGTFTQAANVYIQTPQLGTSVVSTSKGIVEHTANMFPYLSTPSFTSSLISSVTHLGTAGYISTAQFDNALISSILGFEGLFVNSAQLASTIDGSNNYIHTFELQSTTSWFQGWRGVFYSSLTVEGTPVGESFPTLISSVEGYPSQYTLYAQLSTVSSFSLASFSPYIRDTSKIVIEYSPTVMFSPVNSMASGYQYDYTLELRYNYNNKQVDKSFYTTCNFLFYQYSNVFSQKMIVTFSGSELKPLLQYPFSVFHTIFAGTSNAYTPTYYFCNQTFTNLTSPTNSLFVSIYN